MTWTLYKEIKYDTDGIPAENLTDFPKLISISTDADIASECGSGGGIKFTSADGMTDLDFGLYPSTNLTAGTILARVKVTLLTAASVGDVICRLYYSASESTTEDKAGTVSNNYALFCPLEEDPSGLAPQMLDWVTDSNIGTSLGTMTSGDLVAGEVGNQLDFDGSNDSIDLGNPAALELYSTMTIEAIVTPASVAATRFVYSKDFSTGNRGYGMGISSGAKFYFEISGGNVTGTYGATLSAGVTYGLAATLNGSNSLRSYIDGSLNAGPYTHGIPSANTSAHAYISGRHFSGALQPFPGKIDEVRVSSVVRSANWIAYAYTDDFDNADTFTLGDEEGGGGGSSVLLVNQNQRRLRHLIGR